MNDRSRSSPTGPLLAFAALATAMWIEPAAAQSLVEPPASPTALASQLGCVHCHSDLPAPSTLRENIPDLGSAGLRYRPAYLFEFLGSPTRVRKHLGAARMPGFHLTERETVALVAFLESQTNTPSSSLSGPVAELDRFSSSSPRSLSAEESATAQSNALICLSCHTLNGVGGTTAVDLAPTGYRLQRNWLTRYLAAPSLFGIDPTVMPAQFFTLDSDTRSLRELLPDASGKLQLLVDYLEGLRPGKRAELERRLRLSRDRHPDATSAEGERLFRSFNCAACHRHPAILPRPLSAPPLQHAGTRLRGDWLRGFLEHPTAVRPAGFHPGDGGRMPDFRLSAQEAGWLTDLLMTGGNSMTSPASQPAPLSAFSKRKARLLIEQKLSCLGCHQLGGTGGRIGPDLTQAGRRLQPDYIHRIITDPAAAAPHAIMPKPPIPAETAALLAHFLADNGFNGLEAAPSTYLPLVSTANLVAEGVGTATTDYRRYCAPCHGPQGNGDGFNAPFLAVQPTRHSDPAYMAQRPNDTLYDGIASGGYILNRSALMPAWGRTLTPDRIGALVGHLRTLCQCSPPAWSIDGSRRTP